MRVTLITSNVGSLFECDEKLHDAWIKTIMKKIHAAAADIVVINTQETGGKDFEHCAGQVEPLFKKLIDHLPEYEKQKVFVDLEWSQFDKFTALGQLILVKKMVTVEQYNFEDKTFYPVKDGLEIVAKALNNHPCVVNQKFPKSFRNGRWGRKGYLHTKWRINKKLFDFVNVHLFHDESNIAVVQDDPMIYSEDRKRALNYVIEELKRGENGIVPYVFIFGDFNFRLHLPSLLERITLKSVRHNFEDDINLPHHGSMSNGLEANSLHPDPIKRSMSAIEFRDPSRVHEVDNGCILRIEKKKFHYIDHPQLLTSWRDYRPDDQEVDSFKDALREFPVNFPPTYPWSEDPDTHECLMNTRAPAWCDRILMNQGAFQLASSQNPEYGCIGQNVCIGDHKPVALSFSC